MLVYHLFTTWTLWSGSPEVTASHRDLAANQTGCTPAPLCRAVQQLVGYGKAAFDLRKLRTILIIWQEVLHCLPNAPLKVWAQLTSLSALGKKGIENS